MALAGLRKQINKANQVIKMSNVHHPFNGHPWYIFCPDHCNDVLNPDVLFRHPVSMMDSNHTYYASVFTQLTQFTLKRH